MNAAEQITNSYCQFVKRWFTMSNITCGTGKNSNNEIDLLAIDGNDGKFHIEVAAHTNKTWHFTAKNIDYYLKKKFDKKEARDFIKDVLRWTDYRRILVCWRIKEGADLEVGGQAKKNNLEVWELGRLIDELKKQVGTSNYQDPIVRTLQLVKMGSQQGRDAIKSK